LSQLAESGHVMEYHPTPAKLLCYQINIFSPGIVRALFPAARAASIATNLKDEHVCAREVRRVVHAGIQVRFTPSWFYDKKDGVPNTRS
jgi:hypothetical protein